MAKSPELECTYIIGQSAISANKFTVSKFGRGERPLQVYDVTYDPSTGYGKCNCPAAAYRGTGSGDKHVLMVKNWLAKAAKKQGGSGA